MEGQSLVKDVVSSGHDVWPLHVGQRVQARLNLSVFTECDATVRQSVLAKGFVLLDNVDRR